MKISLKLLHLFVHVYYIYRDNLKKNQSYLFIHIVLGIQIPEKQQDRSITFHYWASVIGETRHLISQIATFFL